MRHITRASVFLLAGMIASPAMAGTKVGGFDISSNVALASNYVSRGITNSDKHPAVQGGMTVSHSTGVYATVWASSADFQAANNANIEFDVSGGLAHEFANGFKFDLGMIHYAYPGVAADQKLDYNEYYISAGKKFGIVGLNAKYSYSDDFGGTNAADPNKKSAYYLEGAATVDLPQEVVLAVHLGHTAGEHFEGTGLPKNYDDYSVGVSKEMLGFGVDLSLYGTDRNGRRLNGANSDEQLVLKVNKNF
ncbi:MAG: hypothetical protein HQM03_14740 [Magnetococcales bacterium]|nr:hypothetical protein [Magnetococcales bacterium]